CALCDYASRSIDYKCSSVVTLVSFLLQCPCDHRDLHSFPTRRSSDLGPSPAPRAAGPWTTRQSPCLRASQGRTLRHLFGRAKRRSEEHTSELQSLRHLVCRLLLEKKKNRSTNTAARFCQKALLSRPLH